MSGNLKEGGIVAITEKDYDGGDTLDWYCRHHKGNVAYLATRIQELVENPDDEKYRDFFYNHFAATIYEYLKSIYPVLNPTTKELIHWEDTPMFGKASSDKMDELYKEYNSPDRGDNNEG